MKCETTNLAAEHIQNVFVEDGSIVATMRIMTTTDEFLSDEELELEDEYVKSRWRKMADEIRRHDNALHWGRIVYDINNYFLQKRLDQTYK